MTERRKVANLRLYKSPAFSAGVKGTPCLVRRSVRYMKQPPRDYGLHLVRWIQNSTLTNHLLSGT